MTGLDPLLVEIDALLVEALYASKIGEYGYLGRPECEQFVEPLLPVVRQAIANAQTQVANAFVAWAAVNEIAEPPLDWAWFGEITRRYSPLHEDHDLTSRTGQPGADQ